MASYLSQRKGLSKKSKQELMALCKRHHLAQHGTKKDLLARLSLAISNQKSGSKQNKKKKKNASCKHSLLSSSTFVSKSHHQQDLVYGYIRKIEHISFIPNCSGIPLDIYDLCTMYYVRNNFVLMLFNTKTAKHVHAADFELNMNRTFQMYADQRPYTSPWINNNISSFCYSKNVTLPSQISAQLTEGKKLRRNVIFQCCSNTPSKSQQSAAYIMDNTKNVMHHYSLPVMERTICKSRLLFSENVGLLSFGGQDAKKKALNWVFRLEWKSYADDAIEAWKWEKWTNLARHRVQPTCVHLSNEAKVMVIGGYFKTRNLKYESQPEMYDLNKKGSTLIACSNATNRDRCGAFYDEQAKRVYVGGGFCADAQYDVSRQVSFFECAKDKWVENAWPATRLEYTDYPLLFQDGQLLYIVGHSGMESYDLRSRGKWNIVYHQSDAMTVFGITETMNPKFEPVLLH